MDEPVFKAIKAQGKSPVKVNKLRTEANMPDIVEEFNTPVFDHNHIGHIIKNELGLGKGVTFTASHGYEHIKVPAWLKKEAKKIAEARNLDFHATDTNIYLGVKDGDAVLQ